MPSEAMRYKQTGIEDLNKRPACSFDAGREHVFDLKKDAYSAVTIREDDATYFCCVDFSTLICRGRPLFEIGAMEQLKLNFKDSLKWTTSWSDWDDWVWRPRGCSTVRSTLLAQQV